MELNDKDLLSELVAESREHLAAVEPDLLLLEKERNAVSDEVINRIFRAVHSIKGGFAFFGLANIKNLSHAMENVFDHLRNRRLTVSPELMDALFRGLDKLKLMLGHAEVSDTLDIQEDLHCLTPFLAEKGASPVPAARPAAAPASVPAEGIARERLVSAVKRGATVYRIAFHGDRSALEARVQAWQALGEILDISPAPEGLTRPADLSILFASVLEPDLITAGLELPESQVAVVDISALKSEIKAETKKGTAAKARTPSGASPAGAAATAVSESSETLRVRLNLLNRLMNLAGELVLSRNQLMQNVNRKVDDVVDTERIWNGIERSLTESFQRLAAGADAERIKKEAASVLAFIRQAFGIRVGEIQGLSVIIQNIDRVTSEIQENIMQTRLQPVSVVFNKFPRVIRDLAKELGKEIRLEISGADVELDKSIIEMLSDPLTHLVRNCVDHGIEEPVDREDLGKAREGVIRLKANHESGKVIIEISDDGAGIDIQRLRTKALEKNLITREEADRMNEKEMLALIFLPGFSTAARVSEVSGRGVGMDVVKTNIERLGGVVEVSSVFGKGTSILMTLPLTLAIIPSLIVSVVGRRFAIPQVGLEELVRIRARDAAEKIETVHGSSVLRLRGKLLPLVRLADVLGMKRVYTNPGTGEALDDRRQRLADRRDIHAERPPEADKRVQTQDRRQSSRSSIKIIVLKVGANRFGLVVDDVHDNEEIIVKPLSSYLKKCTCYAGAAILGDGNVAMILDALGIANTAGLRFADLERESLLEKERHERSRITEEQEILTFRNGSSECFGLDLAMVARVEKVAVQDLVRVGDKEYLKYKDRSLRLLRLHHFLPIQPAADDAADLFVIVPKLVHHPLGIIATQVEDVLHSAVVIDKRNVTGPGILGSAVIGEALLVLLDIYSLFEMAEPELYQKTPRETTLLGRKILLAEDTAFFRTVVENYLHSFGCEVDAVKDGEEAWQRITSGARYDLLLSDIEMPVLNGLELVRKVKESAKFKALPVVMLTALKAEKYRRLCEEAGADAFELKLDKGALRGTLERVLGA